MNNEQFDIKFGGKKRSTKILSLSVENQPQELLDRRRGKEISLGELDSRIYFFQCWDPEPFTCLYLRILT